MAERRITPALAHAIIVTVLTAGTNAAALMPGHAGRRAVVITAAVTVAAACLRPIVGRLRSGGSAADDASDRHRDIAALDGWISAIAVPVALFYAVMAT